MIEWADDHPGAITTIATVVLVLVTVWYVRLTRELAELTRPHLGPAK